MYYCPPPSLRGDKTLDCMSAWRTRFDVERKKKAQTNQDKHNRRRTATKTNNHVTLVLTTSRQSPSYLPSAPAPMLQEKNKKTTQEAHCMKNKTTMYPPPSLRLDKPSHVACRTRLAECAAIIAIFALFW